MESSRGEGKKIAEDNGKEETERLGGSGGSISNPGRLGAGRVLAPGIQKTARRFLKLDLRDWS